MIFNILIVELNKDSTSWISLLGINSWELFYWEKDPKHAGGKMTFLTLFGVKLIRK